MIRIRSDLNRNGIELNWFELSAIYLKKGLDFRCDDTKRIDLDSEGTVRSRLMTTRNGKALRGSGLR